MKEIITVNVGQAGLQIADVYWELFCREHFIEPDGRLSVDSKDIGNGEKNFQTFCRQTGSNKYVPRCLHVDLQPTIIEQIRGGDQRQFYNPNLFVNGKQDAAGNYARGYYTLGKEIVGQCMDRIRTLADDCDDLQGFFVLSSIGGGTGSGLGSLLLERLSADYAKKTKVSLNVFPSSELSTAVTEPYNSVLALHKLLEHTDVSVVFDNEALCSIDRNFLDVEKPEYRNVNQLTAQVVSSLALSMQTKGNPYSNLDELSSIHVPYSRAHFLLASYSPFIPNERDCFNYRPTTVSAITNSLFKSSNFLANCDPRHGKYLACSIAYRGDVTPSEVNASIKSARSNNCEIQFVDWVPVGFRLGINYTLPHALIGGDLGKVMRSATMLSNTTATIDIFSRMAREFDTFHDKQTHSGQYTQEGMDEDEFRQTREDLSCLILDYEEMITEEADDADENMT